MTQFTFEKTDALDWIMNSENRKTKFKVFGIIWLIIAFIIGIIAYVKDNGLLIVFLAFPTFIISLANFSVVNTTEQSVLNFAKYCLPDNSFLDKMTHIKIEIHYMSINHNSLQYNLEVYKTIKKITYEDTDGFHEYLNPEFIAEYEILVS